MLDLNNPVQFTPNNVSNLIASGSDLEDCQLRVTKAGIAYLSKTVGADNIDDILFRFDTWDAGINNVGLSASQNQKWVSRIYDALKNNFPTPTNKYIDKY
jgi:hypothetical protein